MEVLLLGVSLLCAAVGVTEDGAEDSEGDSVVEGRAESDGRGLDGGEVCRDGILAMCLCYDAIASKHAQNASYDLHPRAGKARLRECRQKGRHTVEGGHCDGCECVEVKSRMELVIVLRARGNEGWETRNARRFCTWLRRPAPDMGMT